MYRNVREAHRRRGVRRRVLSLGLLAGCAGPLSIDDAKGPRGTEPRDCSLSGRMTYIQDLMTHEYLWADQVEAVSPFGYTDPAVYMADLRYASLDRWSYARDLSEANEWFSSGAYVGGGYALKRDAADRVRFSLVYPDGPAGEAGLSRGDRLLAINGQPLEELVTADAWEAAFGPVEAGAVVAFDVRSPGEDAVWTAEVVLAEVTAPPILSERVFTLGDRTVGYFMLTTFIETAHDALDVVFRDFKMRGVDTVVVDLRYNGGGLLAVGRHLASLLAPDHAGDVYQRYWYNEDFAELNTATHLDAYEHGIAARDVVMLTTGATASASEIVMHALEPYRTVSRMGATTAGKPVGMNHYEACDLLVAPITFQMGSRDTRATYFDGLTPDCAAEDDLLTALGEDLDPMMAAATAWLEGRTCPEAVPVRAAARGPVHARNAWSTIRAGGIR